MTSENRRETDRPREHSLFDAPFTPQEQTDTDSEAEDDCEESVYSPTRRSKDRSAQHKIDFDLDGAKAAIKERERAAREEALRERTWLLPVM